MSNNPYQSSNDSPASIPPPSLSGQKPVAITVLGVLNLAFAAMGVCGAIASVGMFMMPQNNNPQMENSVMELMNSTAYQSFLIVTSLIGFIFTIVLAVAGVGLLQTRRYGRTFSIVYGWYGIIMALVVLVANAYFLLPLLQDVENMDGAERAGAIGGVIGGVFGSCFSILYPAVLLFFMYRPNVVAALKD